MAFALTVPEHNNLDIYFSLRVPVANSWAGVGIGSDDMKGALYLLVYRNRAGDNVTFSPRVGWGNYEPQHFPDVQFRLLPGTGVRDGYMVLNAICTEHCRSWPAAGTNSGYIDVSSPNQHAIYAVGPREGFRSDDPAAPIKYHREFGTFTIDMQRTQGSPDPPVLNAESRNNGTSLERRETGKTDTGAIFHAMLVVLFVIVVMPVDVYFLSTAATRLHGLSQVVGILLLILGVAAGIETSFRYQRVRCHTRTRLPSLACPAMLTRPSPVPFVPPTRSSASLSSASSSSSSHSASSTTPSIARRRPPPSFPSTTPGCAA